MTPRNLPYGTGPAEQFEAAMKAQDSRFAVMWDKDKICFESRESNICIRQVFTVAEARRMAADILGACDKAEGK